MTHPSRGGNRERFDARPDDNGMLVWDDESRHTLHRYWTITEAFKARSATAIFRRELTIVAEFQLRLQRLRDALTQDGSPLRAEMDKLLDRVKAWSDQLERFLAIPVAPLRPHSERWLEVVLPESAALEQLVMQRVGRFEALARHTIENLGQKLVNAERARVVENAIKHMASNVEEAREEHEYIVEVLGSPFSAVDSCYRLFMDTNTPTADALNCAEYEFLNLGLHEEPQYRVLDVCKTLLDSLEWENQIFAVGLIGHLELAAGIPLLIKALASKFTCIRIEALLALELIGTPPARAAIRAPQGQAVLARIQQLADRHAFWSWSLLGSWGRRPHRLKVWEQAATAPREATAGSLAASGETESTLIARLADPDWAVRRTAARRLSKHPTMKTVHALKAMFDDADFEVQHAAYSALGDLASAPDPVGKAAGEALYQEGFLVLLFDSERQYESRLPLPTERLQKLAPVAELAG